MADEDHLGSEVTYKQFNILALIFALVLVLLYIIKIVTALNGDDIFN